MSKLSPSILSLSFDKIDESLDVLKKHSIRYVHIDVMDGKFVPNVTKGIEMLNKVKSHSGNSFILDTHLMIEDPKSRIDEYVKAGADIITVHYEACDNIDKVIDMIRKEGLKVGVSIKPTTDVTVLDRLLKSVDLVLIMSVEPGFGGQKFMEDSLMKVAYLKKQRELYKYNYVIEIDGGVNHDNIKRIVDAGTDLIVAGTAIFNGDPDTNIIKFMELL